MRAAGLVCLGAGAGLIRADLRDVHGTDVVCRSGGVVVCRSGGVVVCRSGGVVVVVRGGRSRAVPVLARYHWAVH